MTTMSQLRYGDNLDVLRRHVARESVDLIYLNPRSLRRDMAPGKLLK